MSEKGQQFTNIISANSSWPLTIETINNNITTVTLDYSALPFTTGNTDTVTLVLADNISSQVDSDFALMVGNATKWTQAITTPGRFIVGLYDHTAKPEA